MCDRVDSLWESVVKMAEPWPWIMLCLLSELKHIRPEPFRMPKKVSTVVAKPGYLRSFLQGPGWLGSLLRAALYGQKTMGVRWPGIEPGSTAWKAAMLTTIPPTQGCLGPVLLSLSN